MERLVLWSGPFYLDANGTDGCDPSLVDRVYPDGTRIASDDSVAIAEREADDDGKEDRRRELSDRVRKVTKSSEVAVNPKDLKDAIQALAEAVGIEV